jgi:hypothetical protein
VTHFGYRERMALYVALLRGINVGPAQSAPPPAENFEPITLHGFLLDTCSSGRVRSNTLPGSIFPVSTSSMSSGR